MRFRRRKDDRVLVVGIFQSSEIGRAVLKNAHRAGFRRAAVIYASSTGRLRVGKPGLSVAGAAITALALSVAIGAVIFRERGVVAKYGPVGLALVLTALVLVGALAGWLLVRFRRRRIDEASLGRCTSTILPGETVVLGEVKAIQTPRLLAIMRDVEADAPVTFAFHSPPPFQIKSSARPLGHELPSAQRLTEDAARLADELSVNREAKPRGPSFLSRVDETDRALEWANVSLTMSTEAHHAFTLSAEWLLDNAYLIREYMTDLRESLPQEQYGELPLVASGAMAGLPRIYQLASEIVAESGGALEPEFIQKFLVAFQAIAPLNIAELWALPLMLRLQLLESLRTIAIQVEQQQSQSEEADFWANRLITALRHGSAPPLRIMEQLVERYPEPTPHFASEVIAHLYDEEAALPVVSGWLEHSLRAPLLEVIQQEHRRQAVQQTALANLINSCRRIAQVQWREVLPSISWAENKLADDPAEVYARMDFETRDRCRSAVEKISRWSKCSEQKTIEAALALAKAADSDVA
jgi:cyclic beta-1,2-glucan synthetase